MKIVPQELGGGSGFVPAAQPSTQKMTWFQIAGLTVMLTGTFMAIMDVFIVNVAIPSIRHDLGATFAQIEFVVAGYSLTYALALITCGRLGDIFGRRKIFMIGLTAFILTSALCGAAPTAAFLVYARLAQGLAAAILFPQVFSLMRVEFVDPRARAVAFSTMGVVIGLAVVVGQVLGGFLVDADIAGLAWRPVFLINVPMGLIALALAPRFLTESTADEGRRIDYMGIVLSSIALGLLLFPLIQGRELGWPAWSVIMLLLAVPAMGVFGWDQRRKTQAGGSPLLDTRLFADRAFVVGTLAVLFFYSTLNSTWLTLTLLLQVGLGLSPLQAGMILAINAVAFMVTSVITGRLPTAWSRTLLIAGAVITAGSILFAAAVAWHAAPLTGHALIPALILRGAGQGLLMTPLLNAILSRIEPSRSGAASGLVSTMQQVGGSLGVAVMSIIFFMSIDRGRGKGLSIPLAYAHGFAISSIFAVAALVLTAVLLTMLPRHRQGA
jgi:EmrB/QacA subfamily drug resistance transporter